MPLQFITLKGKKVHSKDVVISHKLNIVFVFEKGKLCTVYDGGTPGWEYNVNV